MKNNRDDCASGWALCNAALELREKRHPGFAITRDFKAEMRRRLCALAGEAGAAKANELGDGLLLVMEGGNFTRTAFSGSEGPYMVASSLAGMLLDAHCSIHRRCA